MIQIAVNESDAAIKKDFDLSVRSPCSLCLGGRPIQTTIHHGGTENTETAQRIRTHAKEWFKLRQELSLRSGASDESNREQVFVVPASD